jgi:TRAP-type C4-dicarboxylate transport system substrate-binding protein
VGGSVLPVTNLEFYEYIYQYMGIKEIWQEAYRPHNVAHLTYMVSDEWGAMVSTRPVSKFADFRGMKVRAFGIWADWLAHNGASIVTVPGGEVYTAMQTRILDAAAFGSPDAWAGMKMHEVAKFYINPSVAPYDIVEVIMNLRTFNSMPADLQEVLTSAARVFNAELAALTIATDARGRKRLAEGGMQTIMIPDEELIQAPTGAGTASWASGARSPSPTGSSTSTPKPVSCTRTTTARSGCRSETGQRATPFLGKP